MATSYNANIGTAIIQIFLNNESLKKGLDEAKAKVTSFVKSVNEWANFAMKIGTAVTTPFAFSIRTFAAFDDKMRQVQAVTAETGVAFERLTEYAKKLGRETAFTATQVSDGMLALGRMGFNAAEIQNATKHVMNLSIVTGTELGTAAEIAANNMRVFGLEADKTETVADILAVTANSSAQTLTDLGEALKMAGPHAARAGADITDTAAALGILANMGIRGSLAGTALANSYKKLANPQVVEFLRQYGINSLNADGSMRKLRDTLVDISKVMANMTNAEQINFAEEVFDARGSLGGGTLAVNTAGIDNLIQKLQHAEGSADAAAKKWKAESGEPCARSLPPLKAL